jgi:hypothetical protein
MAMELPLHRILRELFGEGYFPQWINFLAEPQHLFLFKKEEKEKKQHHSALLIGGPAIEFHIFDGTGEQFGLMDHNIMTLDDVVRSHMEREALFEETSEENKEECLEAVQDRNWEGGYWGLVVGRMDKILEEVDWNSLHGLSVEECRERGRLLGRKEFAADAESLC